MATPSRAATRGTLQTKRARQAAFLAAFVKHGVITAAAEEVGVTRDTHYVWLREDMDGYADRFDAAQEASADRLEKEAIRRAADGIDEYVVSQGRLVYVDDPETGERIALVKRVYSDQLMALLLRGHRPEKYRDRQSIEHSGAGGGPIHIDDARERLVGQLDSLAERQRSAPDPSKSDAG